MRRVFAFLSASVLVVACANPVELTDVPDVGVGSDASLKDSGLDATKKDSSAGDASVVDAQGDSTIESGADASLDGASDATLDAMADATLDASVDATLDAGVDAALDAGVDASVDASVDGGDGGIVTGNDTCPNAVALTSNVTVSGDTTNANDDYDVNVNNSQLSLVCDLTTDLGLYNFDGNDVVFTIAVPSGKTLTAVVTPNGLWDPALVLSTDCNNLGSTCVGGDDFGGGGDPETGTYTNSSGQTVNVFVIVDSYDISEYGTFTLKATVQ